MKISWIIIPFLLVIFLLLCPVGLVLAEKEDFSTSFEEFLPLGAKSENHDSKESYSTFMQNPDLIKDAKLASIRFLKEQKKIVFNLTSENPDAFKDKHLKYEVITVNFPPRVVLRMYGVKSDDRLFKFFSNIDIVGIVQNPFLPDFITEYVIFFKDWLLIQSYYDDVKNNLSLTYEFTAPPFTEGYGIRIADTNIDPLSQVIEIKNELRKSGIEAYLLVANDHKTIVLESPFYPTKEDAVNYMESLESFGYKGKLAIRSYREFPKANRFEIVSEPVVTTGDHINLQDLVYKEFKPEKIYKLGYREIYELVKDVFSPKIQSDEELLARQYFNLGNIYSNYETEDENIKNMAIVVAVKFYEIVYFYYPKTAVADDALWDMAMIIRETGIHDVLTETECYKRIVEEYPEGDYYTDALSYLKESQLKDSGQKN